jgi:hypothetical protein
MAKAIGGALIAISEIVRRQRLARPSRNQKGGIILAQKRIGRRQGFRRGQGFRRR